MCKFKTYFIITAYVQKACSYFAALNANETYKINANNNDCLLDDSSYSRYEIK